MARMVKITGAKELEKALLLLSRGAARKAGRTAVRKAAKPILDAAKANVPVRSGRLKKSLQIKFKRQGRGGDASLMEAEVRVRPGPRRQNKSGGTVPGSQPNVYGAFVEFGTVHNRPQPFMRPAWEAEGGQSAIDRMGEELGKAIEVEAAKLGKGKAI